MRQFRTILGFELQNYFKNKIFVSVTIIIMLAVAGGDVLSSGSLVLHPGQ